MIHETAITLKSCVRIGCPYCYTQPLCLPSPGLEQPNDCVFLMCILYCIFELLLCSRSEMQQLLEEMTQHMQQQSDSHMYLEKLRTENERMTLQEKDRQVRNCRIWKMTTKQRDRVCIGQFYLTSQGHFVSKPIRNCLFSMERVKVLSLYQV